MPLFLLTFLKSKYTWYALAALAVVLGFFVLRAHYVDEGKKSGVEEQKQTESATFESMRKSQQDQLDSIVKSAEARIADATARANAASAQVSQQNALVMALAAQRATATQTVERVADSDLHAYNIQTLALRDPHDSTTCYNPTEERAIASAVTQYPLCQRSVTESSKEIDALRSQVAAVNDKVSALGVELTAEKSYTSQLFNYYVTLYNDQAPSYRAAKCLGLWKCGKRTIPTPKPETLKR